MGSWERIGMDEKLNWLMLAGKFAMDGDPRGMRACAREIFELDQASADGPAVMAEAALYSASLEEAESLAHDAYSMEPKNLRARLVLGGIAAHRFELGEELSLLRGVVEDAHKQLKHMEELQNDQRLRMHFARNPMPAEQERAVRKQAELQAKILRYLLYRALGWLADAEYLAGRPDRAAGNLLEASSLAETRERQAELYSKHLFLRNYRELAPQASLELAEKYQQLIEGIHPYRQEKTKQAPDKKLRIGYISPDFRQHAVANFVVPFFRDFDLDHFSVYCYSTGQADQVTERLRRFHIAWRDVRGRSAGAVALDSANSKMRSSMPLEWKNDRTFSMDMTSNSSRIFLASTAMTAAIANQTTAAFVTISSIVLGLI